MCPHSMEACGGSVQFEYRSSKLFGEYDTVEKKNN